ncbi:class I SAM-dependent methyltransferase [bacterium]|nr:class I SAM-dependent methyltransferase [bacterium]
MSRPISPYHKPGFYDEALARGRHRDIVGGRWEETGLVQMQLLLAAGLDRHHSLLDIGAGALRLGCRAVPYLDPGRYWATDLSGALLRRGFDLELADKSRLPTDHLIEDADFAFPGVPAEIDFAMAFAVFTHLPLASLASALPNIRARFPRLQKLLFTVFLAPDAEAARTPLRQPDGVVTHADRAPYHFVPGDVLAAASAAGFTATLSDPYLPRGQRLCIALPRPDAV